jgi:hypothetical protein
MHTQPQTCARQRCRPLSARSRRHRRSLRVHMRFVPIFVCVQSVVALARSSADFMAELRELIAADAQVADADILSIHCGVVELTDRFDADELVNADVLVVRLSAPPQAPLPAGSSGAAPLSGHKRGAEDSAAAAGSAPAEGESGSGPAAKRSKTSSNSE